MSTREGRAARAVAGGVLSGGAASGKREKEGRAPTLVERFDIEPFPDYSAK